MTIFPVGPRFTTETTGSSSSPLPRNLEHVPSRLQPHPVLPQILSPGEFCLRPKARGHQPGAGNASKRCGSCSLSSYQPAVYQANKSLSQAIGRAVDAESALVRTSDWLGRD